MNEDLMSFCEDYVGNFLLLIDGIDDEYLVELDANREEELERIQNTGYVNDVKKQAEDDINETYRKNLFEKIKETIATEDPELFREIIQSFNEFLIEDSDLASALGMKIPDVGKDLKMGDYYDNYLIALKFMLESEIKNETINANKVEGDF